MSHVIFRIMGMIVRLAPIGVFGAIAFTTSKYGVDSLRHLGGLVVVFYATCAVFVLLVLGTVLRVSGLRLWPFLGYLREELLIVLGTASSDAVLPQIMRKLEHLGIRSSTVGLVIPTGYSFNLDGFSIYLTLAIVFIAHATGTPLAMNDLVTILLVSLVTSKGAHGIPGSALVILAATLAAVPAIPVVGLVLVLSVDWFMGIGRALTNLIGNCIATVAIARWEKDIDLGRARVLAGEQGFAFRTASAPSRRRIEKGVAGLHHAAARPAWSGFTEEGTVNSSSTLVGSIVQSLRESIEQGRWAVGEMLPGQRELAEQLGISRPCLREAVTVLETLGMVRSLPGKGVQVMGREAAELAITAPRDHSIEDVIQLRYALEPFIVGLVAQSIASSDLDRLRLRLMDLRDAAEDDDMDAFVEAYIGFHQLLGSLTTNPIFQSLVTQAGLRWPAATHCCASAVTSCRNGCASTRPWCRPSVGATACWPPR